MTRWKWDVDRNDPLVVMRVPVTSQWPEYPYLAVFDKASPRRPTRDEDMMLAAFIRYLKSGYSDDQRALMSDQPFDVFPGAHTFVLHKYGPDDWGYRQKVWPISSAFIPPSPRVPTRYLGPLALVQVMDLSQSGGGLDRLTPWLEWKAYHKEVYG